MLISELLIATMFVGVLIAMVFVNNIVLILYIATFLINIAMFDPAANALLPTLVDKKELHKTNAKFSGMQQLMRIFGTMSAGVVNLIGIKYGFVLVIFLFVLSISLISTIVENKRISSTKNSWLFQFKKGFTIYKEKPILLNLTILLAISNFSTAAVMSMSLPYVFENLNGNSVSYGFYTSSWSIGYIVGSFLFSTVLVKKSINSINGMIFSLIVGSISFICLSLTGNILIAVIIEIFSGLTSPLWNIQSSYLYQTNTPEEIRAQVFSLRSVIGQSISPLGILFGTVFSSVFGVAQLMLTVGITSLIIYTIMIKKLKYN